MKKQIYVAVQQHFMSHYRLRIFSIMSAQVSPYPHYTFFSGTTSQGGVATINSKNLVSDVVNGEGVRWKKVRNWWLGSIILIQPEVIGLGVKSKFDCVIYLGSMYHISTWISVILAKLTGKRVLMWTHGYLRDEPGLKGYIREIFYRLADGLLLYGHRGRKFLENRNFESARLHVVYNSLDYNLQKNIRSKWGAVQLSELRKANFLNSDFPILVYSGRITGKKGLDLIFRAQLELERMGLSVNVLVIGDGPDRAKLEEFITISSLLDNVKFIGACYDEDIIGPLLMMSDICVAPGEVGLTCIHSMTYGTPVITHDNPNLQGPEWEAIVPGTTGALFHKGDLNSLVSTIFDWVKAARFRSDVASDCIRAVEKCYTPEYQLEVMNRAVSGLAAEHLFGA